MRNKIMMQLQNRKKNVFLLNCENCRHSTTQQINRKINIYSVRLKAITIEIKVDNEVECTKKQNKLNEYILWELITKKNYVRCWERISHNTHFKPLGLESPSQKSLLSNYHKQIAINSNSSKLQTRRNIISCQASLKK